VDEFEAVLGGTFVQFVEALPHMEVKIQDDGSSVDGQHVLREIPPPPVYVMPRHTSRVFKFLVSTVWFGLHHEM
jgi:hypothetical protein